MRRFLHLIILLGLIASGFTWPSVAAEVSTNPVDLANVPVPIQDLPEDGYQVMAGAYLTPNEAAELINAPRNLEISATDLDAMGVERVYVLDLVLPVDRADVNADIMALVQTIVYEVGGDVDDLANLLNDYGNTAHVTPRDSAVESTSSISLIGPGGDQIRSVVSSDNVVVEIMSLDATGAPDELDHDLIVDGTLARLQQVQAAAAPGISTSGLSITPRNGFFNAPQTGNHGIYRVRDGMIQPAMGELDSGFERVPTDLTSSWYGSSITGSPTDAGIAYTSVWLSSYSDDVAATAALESIVTGDGSAFDDPYFLILSGEQGTWVEDDMLVVTGTINGDAYSGIVVVRQQDDVVIVIGYRTIGALLPSGKLADDMIARQLECLDGGAVCPPFELPVTTSPATPISEIGPSFSSSFGWMLPLTDLDWTVTETMQRSGYDMIALENGQSVITLESVINHHGDPVQCVLDELHNLQAFEEHSDIRLWKDASGNTDGGSDSRHAWSTFRVEPLADERADQEYVTRIDCYRLVTTGANLVVTQAAPIGSWETERNRGDEVRDAIAFPMNNTVRGRIAVSTHDRRTAMILYPWIDRAA